MNLSEPPASLQLRRLQKGSTDRQSGEAIANTADEASN